MAVESRAGDPAPNEIADQALIRRCAEGDPLALRTLYDRYEPPLMRFFLRSLGRREDAEEAVVDTFLKLWRGASSYREQATPRTWIYRIARHTAIDAIRRRGRQPVVDPEVALFDDRDGRIEPSEEELDPAAALVAGFQREQDRRALNRALARLDPSQRTLLVLFYFEGCSYSEIGEITGNSLARLKGLLHRARQRLRDHFVRLRESDEAMDVPASPAPDPALDTRSLLDR